MPPKKVPLSRSPLGLSQVPERPRMYDESLELLAPSPTSSDSGDQYPSLSTPRYEVPLSGRDFKIIKTHSSRLPPLPPSRGPSEKRQRNDPAALAMFASHREQSHTTSGFCEVGCAEAMLPPEYPMTTRMQDLMDIEDMGEYYLPTPKRLCLRHCRCLVRTTLCTILGAALVLASLYLAARPESPDLEIKVLKVTSFKYEEGVDGGAPQVTAGLKIALEEASPNKGAELIYDLVTVDLKYQQSLLSNISVPGFKQHNKNNWTLVVELPTTATTINDPSQARNLLQEISRHNVQTDLKGAVIGHFKMWGLRVRRFNKPVDCKLNVEPENGGTSAKILWSSCYYYPT